MQYRVREPFGLIVAATCAALCAVLAAEAAAQTSTGSEEIILDPELEGIAAPPAPSVPEPEPNGHVRVVLRSRLGIDTAWQDGREEVLEATQIALFEARVRRSARVSFAVGVRARHLFALRERATQDAGRDRYELDLAPTAGYADLTLADPLHLRLGYQSVLLGRFDALNASDILSARDLRSGPTTLPEASEIAQPAARLDWDAASWLSLRAFVLPFFQPHVVNAVDGDYAIAPPSQAEIDAAFDALLPADARRLRGLLRESLSRSGQARLSQSALSAFAPDADLSSPQAALHVSARGAAGELGLTVGTAREHLPAWRFSDAQLRAMRDPTPQNQQAAIDDPRPLTLEYHRFGLASLDGLLLVGPLQLGAELAYMRARTLFVVRPGELPQPERVDLAHAGLRAEYVLGRELAIVVEATAERALSPSSAPSGRFMLLTRDRLALSAVAFVAYSPGDSGITLELGGGAFNGPSYLIAPRLEVPLAGTLSAEAGAFLIGGRGARDPADPSVSLGGQYGDTDQVYVGLRFLP